MEFYQQPTCQHHEHSTEMDRNIIPIKICEQDKHKYTQIYMCENNDTYNWEWILSDKCRCISLTIRLMKVYKVDWVFHLALPFREFINYSTRCPSGLTNIQRSPLLMKSMEYDDLSWLKDTNVSENVCCFRLTCKYVFKECKS